MIRATLKSLLSRKLRLVLSALAVILGVMFVSGAFVLGDTLNRSFKGLFTTVFSTVDVQINAKPKVPAGGQDGTPPIPGNIPASIVKKVEGTSGVKAGSVKPGATADGAKVVGKNGKVLQTTGAPRMGTNWLGEDDLVKLQKGTGPKSDDEVVISGLIAKSAGETGKPVEPGDKIEIITPGSKKKSFTVSGVFGYSGGRDTIGGEMIVAFTTPVAQQLMLGEKDIYSEIQVKAADGVSKTQLRDNLAKELGGDYEVKTGDELAKDQAKGLEEGLKFFTYILLGFAGVALFVGIFLIINTFSIIVAQRTKELALLRAVGASRGQVIGSVMTEATVIGLLASVLGLGAGIGVGALLAYIFANIGGGSLKLAGIGVPPTAIISSFVVGLGVTLIAALIPAFRASRIPPVAAMRDAATPDKPLTKITVAGVVVTGIGVTLMGLALFTKVIKGESQVLWTILGGVLIAFIGVALLTPILSKPVVSVLGRLFSWSVPGKLGRRNSSRNPRRTAITAAALMVGVALVTGVGVVVTSMKASIDKTVKSEIKAELIISGDPSTFPPPSFDQDTADKISKLPGVDTMSTASIEFQAFVKGKPAMLMGVNSTESMAKVYGAQALDGSLPALSSGELVVGEEQAKQSGISKGDTVDVQGPKGEKRSYKVVGIVKKSNAGQWPFILPNEDAKKMFREPGPARAAIKLAPGANQGGVQKEVEGLLKDSPEVVVSDVSTFTKQATSIFDFILNMVQILLALAILIAVLGIINTLALSVIERTREIGLLRAIGLRRGQAMRMITVESVVISLFGALLGMAVGIGLGAAVVRALKDQGLGTLSLPWTTMGTYVIVAAIVGVIAAILPAVRAARVNVLQAISYE